MGIWVNDGTPTMSFVYMPLMWNVCAMQVMLHKSTDNTEDCISNAATVKASATNSNLIKLKT